MGEISTAAWQSSVAHGIPSGAERGRDPTPSAATRRRPLARSRSRARWSEYRALLRAAREQGYELWSLEDWLLGGGSIASRALILRHDVDQHPRSVLPMLRIERELGVRATWYFRWRTADPAVISAVRAAGGQVGLHYETLTRLVRRRGLGASDVSESLVAQAREELRGEIASFRRAFGPLRSVCPHGDTRVPGVSNQALLRDQPGTEYGIAFDSNDAINRHPLGLWLTDRTIPDGRWKDRLDPTEVFAAGITPILLVVHPNNWCSGTSLWWDRARSAALPAPRPGARHRRLLGMRTGTDAPPSPAALPRGLQPPASNVGARDFAPVSLSLRREVLRFYYEDGKRLTDPAGLNTLITNSELAEARAAALEHALNESGAPDLRGLDVLDIGCGFGALALVFAARGARVLAIDPKSTRMEVGKRVAAEHCLPVRFEQASMEQLDVDEGSFDVVVMNNSLCYLVRRTDRREALSRAHRALRPGGWIVVRNPNRLHPKDQFTGIPLLGLLPPRAADAVSSTLGKHRSKVRLVSNRAARRELRRAGFGEARSARRPGESRLRATVAGYQHLTARRLTQSR